MRELQRSDPASPNWKARMTAEPRQKALITFTADTLKAADEMAAEDAEPGKTGDRSKLIRGLIRAEKARREKSSKKSQKVT
jgi:hypothetical protein